MMFSLFFNLITHQLQFVLFIYFWMWDHPVEHDIRNYILKENWLSLHQKPSTVHSSFIREKATEHPDHPCWNVGWLGHVSCRQQQGLVALEASGPLMSRRCCFAPVPPSLWLLPTSYSSSTGVLKLWRGGCDVDVSFVAEGYSRFFSALWPVELRAICPLHRETSRMRCCESCINLQVNRNKAKVQLDTLSI